MARLSTYALAGALLVALAPVAGHAADLPEPPLLEPVPEPVEFGSAWYLRGDVGYKVYRDPDTRFHGTKFKEEDLNDTAVIGGGVGYKFNEWFRADVTLDYEFKSKFDGKLDCFGCTTAGLYSDERAKISALTPLVNVYADLGTWYGITPYVGAGIGASYIMVDNYRYTNPNGTGGKIKGDNNWDFSWALMAGIGYNVSENLVVDAGYRYLNLGDGKTKKFGGVNDKPVKFKDLEAHEFRVGVRYMID
ncbi:outer membrane protein [Methylopila turkensis]|uniref:Outer surface protein n=1 Tax=Methylopila turkensis TaxID=1437816 RepID=A0A9W6N713_9HYPH|nr:outer membrane protein [Methylopila turkensis]GLK79886.1 outer surface protein [Methylopila turkensis]